MGLRRSEVGQILGVAAGTIYRWERFEAETIRTRRGNARLVGAFASLTKLDRPKEQASILRAELGEDESGLRALRRVIGLAAELASKKSP